MRFPSPEEIAAAKTKGGGWTQVQLAEWGIPWPPPKGWRARLEGFGKRRAIEDRYRQEVNVDVDEGDADVSISWFEEVDGHSHYACSALLPDQADDLADQLHAAAAYARTLTPHE